MLELDYEMRRLMVKLKWSSPLPVDVDVEGRGEAQMSGCALTCQ